MFTICKCPVPTTIPSVVSGVQCYENFGQIQKLVFWRRGGSIAPHTAVTSPSRWTTLLAANNGTKATVSPFLGGASVTAGEPRSYGGGNDTLDGIEISIGHEASTFEARVLRTKQSTIKTFKELECEQLDVIFINENGQFGYSQEGAGPARGFPIEGLIISDLTLPGYSEPNYNTVRFKLPSGWSDTFKVSDATSFAIGLKHT